MAQTIQVKRGTKAELSTYGVLKAAELGFCTDTKEVYIGDGMSNSLVGRVGAGYGIGVTADAIAVTAGKGITVDAGGVAANIDGSSIVYDAANGNKLTVAVIDGGTF
jgi:hypothetical protein